MRRAEFTGKESANGKLLHGIYNTIFDLNSPHYSKQMKVCNNHSSLTLTVE